ncbi:hypothetical protein H5119_02260 [Pseudoalteromonas sp. SG45-5]|uniref:hypothetical protein n=1 Tax=unclassified Pseudoalteromonas TaxID=194690 RepID=UPI0015FC27C4|nr:MULTISPECIES: hypothetical protein [unclassified Pseudoalteromonas]MBB1384384.1 hypothetical protein [Pseudoalteromonas sp. SG45-5]MBB1392328.1 hypothetical protein [Pseudoalteromonas sp. SG44-4]MBB1446803.1 hypothetical protein [Pseudoalteromonas sp. SG41-6]
MNNQKAEEKMLETGKFYTALQIRESLGYQQTVEVAGCIISVWVLAMKRLKRN